MKVRPLYDKILVKRAEEKEEAKGGIIIPDTAKEKSQEAEVVAVGQGRILKTGSKLPLEVKVGDRVVLAKYGGTEVKIDNTEYLILSEEDVLGIMIP